MRKAGKHSLEIFSLGIILSVVASVIVKQTQFDLWVQTAVNLGGIAIMLGWAAFLDWKEKAIARRVVAPVEAAVTAPGGKTATQPSSSPAPTIAEIAK
jgi:hypothetical protein